MVSSESAASERASERPRTSADRGSAEASVVVEGLTKEYDTPQGPISAVDDVSFTIESGEVVGVLGPNGAGKTTMIKSILRLVEPTAGEVRVNGVDVGENQRRAYRHVGAVLEGARNVYWQLTIRENLRYFTSLAARDPRGAVRHHEELVELFDLDDKSGVTVNELSRGMKQKVSIAAALARDSSVLFLDEPTLGLDITSSIELRSELRRLVERESLTVVLTSHDMDVIQNLCDRVMILNEGEIIADDSVDSLVDVFRSQTYRVSAAEPLASDLTDELAERYATSWVDEEARTDLDVTLEHEDQLYDLVDRLRRADVTVESLTTVEPNLEDVFLEITNATVEQ